MDSLINLTRTQVILLGGAIKLDLLFNDLSIHRQFLNITQFKEAIQRIMQMRSVARRFGRELQCHRNVALAQVTKQFSLKQAIIYLDRTQQQALMQWLTRLGPFWEDFRRHSPGDYLECNGNIVTDTAVGEAAVCNFLGNNCHLASLNPSSWAFSPVSVTWVPDHEPCRKIEVHNYWEVDQLESALSVNPIPIRSWEQFSKIVIARFQRLVFSSFSFAPLRGCPFSVSASNHILTLLDILNRFKGCFDENDQRTSEGHTLCKKYFSGKKAWFSDSSDSEKQRFKAELTFPHPTKNGCFLFCPWHGKVSYLQLRLHFSWPVTAVDPLYIVYIGPKITKR